MKKMETENGKRKTEIKQGEVVSDKIYGQQEEGLSLYMVVWQRLANSGINYVWAKDEGEAGYLSGYQHSYTPRGSEFVLATVVKINPASMPMEFGRVG